MLNLLRYQNEPIIMGNKGKLHQAFLNIISNAEQSIVSHGKISVVTEIKKRYIYIAITDSGCGISQEYLKKILDPFFTTKAPGKGTGLGLSITYNVIKEYGGDLKFQSQVDIGTTAIVKLILK